MLVTKTNPTGIDWYFQQAQEKLYKVLTAKWGTTDYVCYGRAERRKNATGDGYTAEVLLPDGTYSDAYWDSSKVAVSFFGISGSIQNVAHKGNNKVDVHLVFMVNTKALKPAIAHRADEEVRQDVYNALGEKAYGLEYKGTDLWLENALREYSGSRTQDALKFIDIAPKHIFRLNYTLLFDPNKQALNF